MSIKVLFWNVENFGRSLEGPNPDPVEFQKRVDQVAAHIQGLNPDLFGLSEIKDKVALRSLLLERLGDYDFGITDGAEGIELLAGWRRGRFEQVIFTQRREFRAGNPNLRPGSVVNVKEGGEFLNFLFLHTDSGTEERDYKNRQTMFEKIWKLRNVFDQITAGGSAKFMVLGDLNTMGRKAFDGNPRIPGDEEIRTLADDALDNGMALLSKTHDFTWRREGMGPNQGSNLDHALATTNLLFEALIDPQNSTPASVSVDGWSHLSGAALDDFTENVSDHCSLFCKII